MPGYGGTQRLPRLVGRSRALKLILSGEIIDAAEAYRIGLADELVQDAQVIERSELVLKKIIANAPVSVCRAAAVASARSAGSWADSCRRRSASARFD